MRYKPIYYTPVVAPPPDTSEVDHSLPKPFTDVDTNYAALTAANAIAIEPFGSAVKITLSGAAKPVLLSMMGGLVSYLPKGKTFTLPDGTTLDLPFTGTSVSAGTLVLQVWGTDQWELDLLSDQSVRTMGFIAYANVDGPLTEATFKPLVAAAPAIEIELAVGLAASPSDRNATNTAFLTLFMAGKAALFVTGGTVIGFVGGPAAILADGGTGISTAGNALGVDSEITLAFFDANGAPDSPIPFLVALPQIGGARWNQHPLVTVASKLPSDDPTYVEPAKAAKVGYSDFDGGSIHYSGVDWKISGNVYYPAESDGKDAPFKVGVASAPVVFILHGNHNTTRTLTPQLEEKVFHMVPGETGYLAIPGRVGWTIKSGHSEIPNHAGYLYLQRLFAKMGVISVSVDCNEANQPGKWSGNIQTRAFILGAAIDYFKTKLPATHLLSNKIDFSRTGLLGHSRGGETVLLLPELIAGGVFPAFSPSIDLDGITILGVLALAPSKEESLRAGPSGYAFMTILPAADGDLTENPGAFFYDWATALPFKSQVYVHGANHNYFNTEWLESEAFPDPPDAWGLKLLPRADHQRLLSAYASAFFRFLFFDEDTLRFLDGSSRPAGAPSSAVHWSFAAEKRVAATVDDFESVPDDKNSLGLGVTKMDVVVSKVALQQSAAAPTSFYGKTKGLLAKPNTVANGWYRSETGLTDLAGREIWIRCAEVYDRLVGTLPAAATGFRLGIEDATGVVSWADCQLAGGVARPYYRRLHDEHENPRRPGETVAPHDATKTMLATLRFKALYFAGATPPVATNLVKAIRLSFDRRDSVAMAFDDLQIVDPKKAVR